MKGGNMSNADIIKEIGSLQKEISKKSANKYFQVMIFIAIIFVALGFMILVVNDLVISVTTFYDKKKLLKLKAVKSLTTDDMIYDTSVLEYVNEVDKAEDEVVKKNNNLKHELRRLVEWKKTNKIPNVKIEGKIDTNTFESRHDDYEYDKKKKGDSFWKMIFMPPKYYQFVNKKGEDYYSVT